MRKTINTDRTELHYTEHAFPEEEYRERLSRIRKSLHAQGLDALVIHSPEDINYLSGFNSCGYYSYQHLLIGIDSAVDSLLMRLVEIGLVRATSIISDTTYWSDRDDYVAIAVDTLTAKGLAHARIGIQEASLYLKLNDFRRLQQLLPKVKFVDASSLLPRLRLVKSRREIEYVRRAAEITDIALQAGLERIAVGIRECDVAAAVYDAMFRAGGDPPTYPGTFTSGPRTCFLHGMATERRFGRGELIVMEPMGCYRRYNTNAIRTAVIGTAFPKARDAHALMKEAIEVCTTRVKPGILAEEIDRLSRKITAKYINNRLHRTGYSLELGYSPGFVGALDLLEGNKSPLEPGMVISVEPNMTFYDEGWGVQLGNCLLVTQSGCETLHRTPLDLVER